MSPEPDFNKCQMTNVNRQMIDVGSLSMLQMKILTRRLDRLPVPRHWPLPVTQFDATQEKKSERRWSDLVCLRMKLRWIPALHPRLATSSLLLQAPMKLLTMQWKKTA